MEYIRYMYATKSAIQHEKSASSAIWRPMVEDGRWVFNFNVLTLAKSSLKYIHIDNQESTNEITYYYIRAIHSSHFHALKCNVFDKMHFV